MGLLSEGRPLSWPETKSKGWIVHKYGLEQFITIYKRLKDRKGDTLKWGDEVRIEYMSYLNSAAEQFCIN